jgi:catechol 2,3-dioxygenase-like lactoylglutathione lyase family enzyme
MSSPASNPSAPVLGTRRVCQIAVVVRDIEKARQAYAGFFGLPVPDIIKPSAANLTNHTFAGEPTDAECLLAFFNLENTVLELIQPLGGRSSWQQVLDEKGEGVHHIAFQVTDVAGKVSALATHGISLLHQGGDPKTGQFTYFDARQKLGILVETLEGYK